MRENLSISAQESSIARRLLLRLLRGRPDELVCDAAE